MKTIVRDGVIIGVGWKHCVIIRDFAEKMKIIHFEAKFIVNGAVIECSINEFVVKATNFTTEVEKFARLSWGCKKQIMAESY